MGERANKNRVGNFLSERELQGRSARGGKGAGEGKKGGAMEAPLFSNVSVGGDYTFSGTTNGLR